MGYPQYPSCTTLPISGGFVITWTLVTPTLVLAGLLGVSNKMLVNIGSIVASTLCVHPTTAYRLPASTALESLLSILCSGILGSVWDSTTWTKVGAYGGIFVPHKRGSKFVFYRPNGEPLPPYLMKVSDESPDRRKRGQHYLTMSLGQRKIVEEWLEFIGVTLGVDRKGNPVEDGVVTHHTQRREANLHFFEYMRNAIQRKTWERQARTSFSLGWRKDGFDGPPLNKRPEPAVPQSKLKKLIIYYSGEGSRSNPEITLKDKANIMLTAWDSRRRVAPRFAAIYKARKRKVKK
jgi:hypothetical protein